MACKEAHDTTKLILSNAIDKGGVVDFLSKKSQRISSLDTIKKALIKEWESEQFIKWVSDDIVKENKSMADFTLFAAVQNPVYQWEFLKRLRNAWSSDRADFLEFYQWFIASSDTKNNRHFKSLFNKLFWPEESVDAILWRVEDVAFAKEVMKVNFDKIDKDTFTSLFWLKKLSKKDMWIVRDAITWGDINEVISKLKKFSKAWKWKLSAWWAVNSIEELTKNISSSDDVWDTTNKFLRWLWFLLSSDNKTIEDVVSLYRKRMDKLWFDSMTTDGVMWFDKIDELYENVLKVHRFNSLGIVDNIEYAQELAVFRSKLKSEWLLVDSLQNESTTEAILSSLKNLYYEYLENGRKITAKRFKEIIDTWKKKWSKSPITLLKNTVENADGDMEEVQYINDVKEFIEKEDEIMDLIWYGDIIKNDDYIRNFIWVGKKWNRTSTQQTLYNKYKKELKKTKWKKATPTEKIEAEKKALEKVRNDLIEKNRKLWTTVKREELSQRDVSKETIKQLLQAPNVSENIDEVAYFETSLRPSDDYLWKRRDLQKESMSSLTLPWTKWISSYSEKNAKKFISDVKEWKVKSVFLSNETDYAMLPEDVRKAIEEEWTDIVYSNARQTYNFVVEDGYLKVKSNNFRDIKRLQTNMTSLFWFEKELINMTDKWEQYLDIVSDVLDWLYEQDWWLVKEMYGRFFSDITTKELNDNLELLSKVSDYTLQEQIVNTKRLYNSIKTMWNDEYSIYARRHIEYIIDDMDLWVDIPKWFTIDKNSTQKIVMLSKYSPDAITKFKAREELLRRVWLIEWGLPYTKWREAELYKNTVQYVESELWMKLPTFFEFWDVMKRVDENWGIVQRLWEEGTSSNITNKMPKNVFDFIQSVAGKNDAIRGIKWNVKRANAVLWRIQEGLEKTRTKWVFDKKNISELLEDKNFDEFIEWYRGGINIVVEDFDDAVYNSLKEKIAWRAEKDVIADWLPKKRKQWPKAQKKVETMIDETFDEIIEIGRKAIDDSSSLTKKQYIKLKESMIKKVEKLEWEMVWRFKWFLSKKSLSSQKWAIFLLNSKADIEWFVGSVEKAREAYKSNMNNVSEMIKSRIEKAQLDEWEQVKKNMEELLSRGEYVTIKDWNVVRITIDDAISSAKSRVPFGMSEDVDNILRLQVDWLPLKDKTTIYKILKSAEYYSQNPKNWIVDAMRISINPEYKKFTDMRIFPFSRWDTNLPSLWNVMIPKYLDNLTPSKKLWWAMGWDETTTQAFDYYIKWDITEKIMSNLREWKFMSPEEISKMVYNSIEDTLLNYFDTAITNSVKWDIERYSKTLNGAFKWYSTISEVKFTEAMQESYKRWVDNYNNAMSKNTADENKKIEGVDVISDKEWGVYQKESLSEARNRTDMEFEQIMKEERPSEEVPDIEKPAWERSEIVWRYLDDRTNNEFITRAIDDQVDIDSNVHDVLFEAEARTAWVYWWSRYSTIGNMMNTTRNLKAIQTAVSATSNQSFFASSTLQTLLKQNIEVQDRFIEKFLSSYNKDTWLIELPALVWDVWTNVVDEAIHYVGKYINDIKMKLPKTWSSEMDMMFDSLHTAINRRTPLRALREFIKDGNIIRLWFETGEGRRLQKTFLWENGPERFKNFANESFLNVWYADDFIRKTWGERLNTQQMDMLYTRIFWNWSRAGWWRWGKIQHALWKFDKGIRIARGFWPWALFNIALQIPWYEFTRLLDHSRSFKEYDKVSQKIWRWLAQWWEVWAGRWMEYSPIERQMIKQENRADIVSEMQFGLQQTADMWYRRFMKQKSLYEAIKASWSHYFWDMDSFARWLDETPDAQAKPIIDEIKRRADYRVFENTWFGPFSLEQMNLKWPSRFVSRWFDYRGTWWLNMMKTLYRNTLWPVWYWVARTVDILSSWFKWDKMMSLKQVADDVFEMYSKNYEIAETFSQLAKSALWGSRLSPIMRWDKEEDEDVWASERKAILKVLSSFYMPVVSISTNFYGRQMSWLFNMLNSDDPLAEKTMWYFNDTLREIWSQYKIFNKPLDEVMRQVNMWEFSLQRLGKSLLDAWAWYMRYVWDKANKWSSMNTIPSNWVSWIRSLFLAELSEWKELSYKTYLWQDIEKFNTAFIKDLEWDDTRFGLVKDFLLDDVVFSLPILYNFKQIWRWVEDRAYWIKWEEYMKIEEVQNNRFVKDVYQNGSLELIDMLYDLPSWDKEQLRESLFSDIWDIAEQLPWGWKFNDWYNNTNLEEIAGNIEWVTAESLKDNIVMRNFIENLWGNADAFNKVNMRHIKNDTLRDQIMETAVVLGMIKSEWFTQDQLVWFHRALFSSSWDLYEKKRSEEIKSMNKETLGYKWLTDENKVQMKEERIALYWWDLLNVDPSLWIRYLNKYLHRKYPDVLWKFFRNIYDVEKAENLRLPKYELERRFLTYQTALFHNLDEIRKWNPQWVVWFSALAEQYANSIEWKVSIVNKLIDHVNELNIPELEKNKIMSEVIVANPDVISRSDEVNLPKNVMADFVQKVWGVGKRTLELTDVIANATSEEIFWDGKSSSWWWSGNSATLPKWYSEVFNNMIPTIKQLRNLVKSNQSKLLDINPNPYGTKWTWWATGAVIPKWNRDLIRRQYDAKQKYESSRAKSEWYIWWDSTTGWDFRRLSTVQKSKKSKKYKPPTQ